MQQYNRMLFSVNTSCAPKFPKQKFASLWYFDQWSLGNSPLDPLQLILPPRQKFNYQVLDEKMRK